ncbi:hypothetical protein ncot_19190 [Nocardioides sp. JQ2195]|uniref:hypothetical protein n=1 Tax=Nocardioides sp. JQ2195 TaxID=2592334 RepID=UPI00143EE794|nr:hypothetical protein [Nocardioides sp. JQ2195]QIX28477.1 hypothetical protein ncot_19190 [Nocardioides sp. JQ2195]
MSDQSAERSRPERNGMTPLQKMAMGLVIVAIDTLGTVDILPDFIGWAMVIWGLVSIRLPERTTLLTSAAVCAVVALAVWFPQAKDHLQDAELALKWAVSLPDLLFIFLASRSLATAAKEDPDPKFAGRFGVIMWATCIVAAMPPVADAAKNDVLLGYADVAFVLLWIWFIWNLFAAHAKPYVAARD